MRPRAMAWASLPGGREYCWALAGWAAAAAEAGAGGDGAVWPKQGSAMRQVSNKARQNTGNMRRTKVIRGFLLSSLL